MSRGLRDLPQVQESRIEIGLQDQREQGVFSIV